MRIAFFAEGVDIPASRFRCEQFFPHFERAGIECEMFYGYGAAYNAVHTHRFAPLYKLACRARRAAKTLLATEFDLLFFQRTAFPFTAAPEMIRQALGARTIFDYDDLLQVGRAGRRSVSRSITFNTAVKGATHVIAGNRYLAALADAPTKTTVIPTVVDTEHYHPAEGDVSNRTVTIGWMGTSGNFPSLHAIVPAILRTLQLIPNVRFRIVSNTQFPPLQGVPGVEQISWTRAREIEFLQSFDIGLMPLEDTEATRGKCGFKMLQYMATGSAVAASALGANIEIFESSRAGVLLPPGEDWTPHLLRLCQDTESRKAAARAGRLHVERAYSVNAVVPRYLRLFQDVGRLKD